GVSRDSNAVVSVLRGAYEPNVVLDLIVAASGKDPEVTSYHRFKTFRFGEGDGMLARIGDHTLVMGQPSIVQEVLDDQREPDGQGFTAESESLMRGIGFRDGTDSVVVL